MIKIYKAIYLLFYFIYSLDVFCKITFSLMSREWEMRRSSKMALIVYNFDIDVRMDMARRKRKE